jgi:2-amino-4-hydroxy-6-hydroxymethyldihydropteridine diphosphokinase
MYYENQGWFLNCVVSLETRLGPRELLGRLQAIEARLGRHPGERFGPRVIDIDILLYGSEVISEPGLEIPHPRLAERPFVLVPLDEIRPGLVHPVLRMSVSELVARARSEKRVVRKPGLLTDLQLSLRPRRS